jgi:hypothetical protein
VTEQGGGREGGASRKRRRPTTRSERNVITQRSAEKRQGPLRPAAALTALTP